MRVLRNQFCHQIAYAQNVIRAYRMQHRAAATMRDTAWALTKVKLIQYNVGFIPKRALLLVDTNAAPVQSNRAAKVTVEIYKLQESRTRGS